MTPTQIAKLKQQFIEGRQDFMKRRFSSMERKLYDEVFNKLLSELEQADGKIVSNGKNIQLSATLDKIFRTFKSNEYTNTIVQFSKDLKRITELNKDYFRLAADDHIDKVNKLAKKTDSFLAKRIGVNGKGIPEKGGYIDRLINDDTLKNKVKDATLKAITNGKPVKNLIKEMETIIVGNPNVNGGLTKHFNQYMYDTYNQFDRTNTKMLASDLGMTCFIYQGGRIKSSRKFCVKRDGKVFTTDEAKKWKSMIGQDDGPIADKDNYDPLIDCGGYSCRHAVDYISNSMAKKLRPDLVDKL